MLDLRNRHVLILGLGDSGLAMARWCAWCGAQVSVADSRANPPQAQALAESVPGAVLHVGFDVAQLEGQHMLLKSPGLSPLAQDVAPMLAKAKAMGIDVNGELDLFAKALSDLKTTRQYAPKVIAITGTNGKTTTTSLTALLVKRAGLRVGLAGNIGPTLLDTLREALLQEPEQTAQDVAEVAEVAEIADVADLADVAEGHAAPSANAASNGSDEANESASDELAQAAEQAPVPASNAPTENDDFSSVVLLQPPPVAPTFEVLPHVWVLELSSFQLDQVKGFDPSAAVVLNITQDHLDWHGTMADYVQAKSSIYGPTTTMVVNQADDQVMAMIPAPVMVKSAGRGRAATSMSRHVVRFGLEMPAYPGDFGLVSEGGMHWLVRALEADPTIKLKAGESHEVLVQRLMPMDALQIRGRHNVANALAALALATAVGVPLAPMLHGLREYRGEPHRVEMVMTLGGITAIDDSKGTNVGATVAAVVGLGPEAYPGKLVLILGGDGKGQDFGPLREPVSRYARALAFIGRDGQAMEDALHGSARLCDASGQAMAVAQHSSLEMATRWAFEQAQAGDTVLLSPACASLDMFRNYAHRAEVFIQTVHDLAHEQGVVA
jgi:UDP-N-acetylmuramoylalanine--D-glutamate ligase